METKERDITIDIAKGLGIMLVVACHANFAPLSPGRFFHMPLFFFLTGYLSSFQTQVGQLFWKKIKTLYLPFVIAELIFVITNPLWISMGISQPSTLNLYQQIIHIVCFDNIALILSPIWFLTALFAVNIFCHIWVQWWMKSTHPWLPLFTSVILCAIGIANTRMGCLQIIWSINFKELCNVVLVAQLFCILGFWVKTLHIGINKLWLAIIAFIYLYVAKLCMGLSVDMRTNHYSSIILFILAAIGGIYLTLFISQKLHTYKPIGNVAAYICQLMGKASLYILILHIFCFKIVGFFQEKICQIGLQNNGWENPGCHGMWTLIYIIAGLGIPTCIYCIMTQIQRHVQN